MSSTKRSPAEERRGRRLRIAIAGAGFLCLLAATSAWAAVGGLTQKAGTDACVSESGSAGACADGIAIDNPFSVAVSPDGANVYTASDVSQSVAIFDRNPVTGALTQKAGTAACVSEDGTGGSCVDGIALSGADSVVVSPNGASVYVASDSGDDVSDGIAIFDRDPATGALTQKPGTAGCVTEDGTSGSCTDGVAIEDPKVVTVSPDGASVYVISDNSNAIAIFDRNPATGVLTQKTGTAGCISEDGTAGACADGRGLFSASSVTVSPDGANVYAAATASDAVAIFDRDESTGGLAQKPGTAGCISDDGTAGQCVDGRELDGANWVAISPDGENAYVTASQSSAVTIFDRNASTGALTLKPGVPGCVSLTGSGGTCADGVALNNAFGLTASPDGLSVYASAPGAGAVAILDRDSTGGNLAQKPGTSGCISDSGSGGECTDVVAMNGARVLAVSPDGANLYAVSVSSDAVSVFDRDVAPATTITAGPSGVTSDRTPSFSFSSTEPGGFECRIDGGTFAACSGPGGEHTTASLPDGAHVFSVRAVDSTENADPTPAERAFTVDTAAPETEITKPPKKKLKTRKRKAKVKVSFRSESGATFECRLDESGFEACSSPFSARAKSKAGKGRKHVIEVRATDEAGNVEGGPARAAFKLIRRR